MGELQQNSRCGRCRTPEPQSFVELTTYREIWRCSHTVSHEIVARAPLSSLGLQRLLGKPDTTDVLFLFDTGFVA